MRLHRLLGLGLASCVVVCGFGATSVHAQARTPANRRPQMPPRPPIFPATNGRPAAFQNGHGAFGNVQSAAGGAAGQAGQFGQGGGGLGGGFGGIGGGGLGGGLGGIGGGGLGGGGLGGLGGGGMKGFAIGGGSLLTNNHYQNGVGLSGGTPALSGVDFPVELPRRRSTQREMLLLGPAVAAALRD